MTVSVRPATAAGTPAAVALLARAFHEHPVYRHVLPDDGSRRRRLPGLMRTMVVTMHGDAGPLDVAHDGESLVGAAAWHEPGATEPGGLRSARAVVGMAWATRRHLGRWSELGTAMAALRPAEPHWYLFHVGAEPGRRGRGVGSALVEHGLARADPLPVHLECARDLVGYYARFGFAEGDPVPLAGLDLVTMTRPGRA
ncbi:GNAT family N-acetyltransferase [Actinomycetospora sp. CA-084318]|uniref:GNAT family N-acetyltransferase n=1 Tax=Actinomycetospora sp. CA-084318 TaxID=3239892 RepID=UPI003D95B9C6